MSGARRLLTGLAVLPLLAACSAGGSTAAPSAPVLTTGPPPTGSTSEGPGASLPPVAPAPSGSPADAAPPELVLQGTGLGLLQDGDVLTALPFGSTPGATVQDAVEDLLGPSAVTALPSCPQGPRTALVVDGFTVLLAGDLFVGWADVGAADRAFSTADGIGTGSRLADVRSALPDVTTATSPTGATTWTTASGLSGTLSGPEPDADVTSVSAGETCPT